MKETVRDVYISVHNYSTSSLIILISPPGGQRDTVSLALSIWQHSNKAKQTALF